MLRGMDGRQAKEIRRLASWLAQQPKADVVSLATPLLAGLAPALRSALGAPIVCTMQGEDSFVDALLPPYADEAWSVMRERTADIDAFVAVSNYYGEVMQQRLALPEDKVSVIVNGIDLQAFVHYVLCGAYTCQMDTNQDGLVDETDVPSFVALLLN